MDNHKRHSDPFQRPTVIISRAASSSYSFSPSKKALKGILAGGITGGLEICITYPTEFVKTQLQLNERSATPKYNGIVDVCRKTITRYGFCGLYRGLGVLIYGSIPKSAIRFGTFEELKKRSVDEKGYLAPSKRMLCGLGAGVCEAIFAVTPTETIKVKFIHDQQSLNPKFKGFLQGVREIIKSEGILGVYRGVFPTMLKQGTNQAIRFSIMETLKDWYRGGDSSKSVHLGVTAIFGVIAGAASVFGNTPLDVVKTRLQGLEAYKYKNTFHCAYEIAKNEGFLAFYKGTVPRLGRVCMDVAITFTIYDSIMEFFDVIWKDV